jgi:hypothetical protein
VKLHDDEPATSEGEKRKYRRAKLITQVRCEALGREGVMVTRDVSLGGMFVNDNDPFPPRSEVSLAFRLSPTAPLLTCKAKVAYTIREVGMGVMFTEIGDDARQALKEFVDAAN